MDHYVLHLTKRRIKRRAASILIQNGYSNVTPLLGGFEAWMKAGYPVEP